MISTLALMVTVVMTGCGARDKTISSPDFSEGKFREVKEGMMLADVIHLIGMPLEVKTQEWAEVWSYFPEKGSFGSSNATDRAMTYDLFGPITKIWFTKEGSAKGTAGNYLEGTLVGLTKEEIEAKFGFPHERRTIEFEIVYRYTVPGGSGTFRIRNVHFDATSRVSAVESETVYDWQ